MAAFPSTSHTSLKRPYREIWETSMGRVLTDCATSLAGRVLWDRATRRMTACAALGVPAYRRAALARQRRAGRAFPTMPGRSLGPAEASGPGETHGGSLDVGEIARWPEPPAGVGDAPKIG